MEGQDMQVTTSLGSVLTAAQVAQAGKAGGGSGGGANGADGGGKPERPKAVRPPLPPKVAKASVPAKAGPTAAVIPNAPRGTRERGSDLEKLDVAELRSRLTPLDELLAGYDALKAEMEQGRAEFRAAREESKKFEEEIHRLEVKYVDILRGPKGPQRDQIIGQLLARRVLVAKLYIGGKEEDDPEAKQGYEVYRLVQDIRAAISEGGDFGAFGRLLRAAVEKGFYEVIDTNRYAKERERRRNHLAFHFAKRIYFPVRYERRRIRWLRSELLDLKHEAVQRAEADREEEYQLLKTMRVPRDIRKLLDPNGTLPEDRVAFAVYIDDAAITKKGEERKTFVALEREREDGTKRTFSGVTVIEIAADPLIAGRKQITVRRATGTIPQFLPRSKDGVSSSTIFPPTPRGSSSPQTAIWAKKLLKFLWDADADGLEQLRLAWAADNRLWVERHHPVSSKIQEKKPTKTKKTPASATK